MGKSKSPARIPAPVVPAFSGTLNVIVKNVVAFEGKVDDIRARMTESISAAFEGYRTLLINMDVPRTLAGSKAIRKAINTACRESVQFTNLVGSGLYKRATLSNYGTSLILCYMNGKPFYPSAFLSETNGGERRPDWWPKPKVADATDDDGEPVGSKDRKPSEVVTVTAEGVCLMGTHFVGMVRRLHGDRVADDLVDAIIDTVPNFKIRAE